MAMPFTTILTFNAHCVTQLYYPIEIINVNIRVLCILIINVDLFCIRFESKLFCIRFVVSSFIADAIKTCINSETQILLWMILFLL